MGKVIRAALRLVQLNRLFKNERVQYVYDKVKNTLRGSLPEWAIVILGVAILVAILWA